jgi:hypothetical protein
VFKAILAQLAHRVFPVLAEYKVNKVFKVNQDYKVILA